MNIQRTVKLKGSNLFSKEKWTTVRLTVESINKIIMKATMLAKIYYLQQDEAIALDCDFYDICFKVVSGQDICFRGSVKHDKLNTFTKMQKLFKEHFDSKFVDTHNLSMSQILGMASRQLETCMVNNIEFHYIQHLNKYLYTHLYKTVTNDKKIIAQARGYLLYKKTCPPLLEQWCADHHDILVPEFLEEDFDTDLKKRPWVYLKHMISMSRRLEASFPNVKLLSPFVIRRSFIPKHISIDTNALVQLLMKPSDIETFVTLYKFENNMEPKLRIKTDLGKCFKKVFDREPTSEFEDFMYQQSFWKYICNWKGKKFQRVLRDEKRDLYFGNSIMTDGCSISFNLVSKPEKKTFKARKKSKKTNKDEFLQDIEFQKDTLYLGCDPGKGDLITITDGYNMFRYTKGKRNHDTKLSLFTKRNLDERSKLTIQGVYNTIDSIIPNYYHEEQDIVLSAYEQRVLSLYNSKSCNLNKFSKWVKAKLYKEEEVTDLYKKPKFRNDKFTKYCLKMRSEDKMLEDLNKFVKERSKVSNLQHIDQAVKDNIATDTNKVVILYGNWGKNPNMKNNAPTPGIGLRRRIHNRIPTFTVNEAYTSKTCPCCKNISLKKAVLQNCNVSKKHHLLRCQNGMCSCRWWNRNVAGSYNILYKGLNELRGAKDPP